MPPLVRRRRTSLRRQFRPHHAHKNHEHCGHEGAASQARAMPPQVRRSVLRTTEHARRQRQGQSRWRECCCLGTHGGSFSQTPRGLTLHSRSPSSRRTTFAVQSGGERTGLVAEDAGFRLQGQRQRAVDVERFAAFGSIEVERLVVVGNAQRPVRPSVRRDRWIALRAGRHRTIADNSPDEGQHDSHGRQVVTHAEPADKYR